MKIIIINDRIRKLIEREKRREYGRLEEGRRKWKVFLDDDVLVVVVVEEGKIEKEGRVVVAEDELKPSIIDRFILNLTSSPLFTSKISQHKHRK